MTDLARSLRAAGFRGALAGEEPLAPFTTWRIGGPAELLASPTDRADLLLSIAWARERGVPWRLLGNGSNLLVRDEGVRGLVVRTRTALEKVEFEGTVVRAGAGASFPAIANLAAARGLAGLEFAAGIPGTLGGALVMNAGWHEHEIAPVVREVEILATGGDVETWPRAKCAFGYRTSAFRGQRVAILGAVLDLKEDDPVAVRGRLETYAASRRTNQPTDHPSCGSVFLKPEGDFAGRLIEQAGLKGTRIGDMEVSSKHANFFINRGNATAADALALVERAEQEVQARFQVKLTREFDLW